MATQLAEHYIQFLAGHYAFAKPADIKFLQEKVLRGYRTAGGVTDGEIVCREW